MSPTATAPAANTYTTPSAEDLAAVHPVRRRWFWAVLIGGFGVIGLTALAGVAFFASSSPELPTEAVVRDALTTHVTAVGQLEPEDAVEVGSDLTGRLAAVLVDENQSVKAGDILAQLDPAPFEHAVTQARAQLASAKASLSKASVEYDNAVVERDRTQRLLDRGAASASELESAELKVKTASAAVATARASRDQTVASLADADADLADTTIRSPIDGVIIHRFVDPGQTVVSSTSATALFEVASDLRSLEVEIGVDEADVSKVQAGQSATFTVSAWPQDTFQAKVVSVDLAPDPDASVVSYNTDLVVDNADGRLRPGMTATADVVVSRLEDVLQVPTLALRYSPSRKVTASGDRVYVLRNGETLAIPVTILGTDGVRTAVSAEGLSENDLVVVGGAR